MSDNIDEFNRKLVAFAKKVAPEKITLFQKKIVLTALKKLIEKTPVDTGRARANWQVTIDVPASSVLQIEDKAGGSSFEKGAAKIGGLGPFRVVWITNNVEYIEILENGGFIPTDPGPSKDKRPDREGVELVAKGFSTQAPQGMLKVTFEELKAQFR